MNFNKRIVYLIDNLCNGNKKKFSENTGIPYTTVSEYYSGKKNDPQISFINKILNHYKNVNALWLITGVGEFFNNGVNVDLNSRVGSGVNSGVDSPISSPISSPTKNICLECSKKDGIIEVLREQIADLKADKRELYNILTGGGTAEEQTPYNKQTG